MQHSGLYAHIKASEVISFHHSADELKTRSMGELLKVAFLQF